MARVFPKNWRKNKDVNWMRAKIVSLCSRIMLWLQSITEWQLIWSIFSLRFKRGSEFLSTTCEYLFHTIDSVEHLSRSCYIFTYSERQHDWKKYTYKWVNKSFILSSRVSIQKHTHIHKETYPHPYRNITTSICSPNTYIRWYHGIIKGTDWLY